MLDEEPVKVALGRGRPGLFATAATARRNLLELIPAIAVRQPIISGRVGIRWHMVMDPESMRHILKERVEDYPRSPIARLILQDAIGEGMFVAEGGHWRWQRRAVTPAFALRHVTALAPVVSAATEAASQRLGDATGPVDMLDEVVRATFQVISDVTFSGQPGPGRAEVQGAIDAYLAQTARISLLDVMGLPGWIPRPARLLAGPRMRRMKRIADDAIAERARRPRDDGAPDLLDLLLDAEDPDTGRRMSRAELRDNLLTFIVAGHETTALSLAWAFYLCAFDPTVQARAADEARAVLRGRAAGAGDVSRLPFCGRIIREAMRLYPPAAFLSRQARRDDRLCGRDVRAGDTILMPIYALHRHHLLWDNPDRFDPDRFLKPHDRYAYLPFGAGPRICVGAGFAMQEAVIILATLLSRFRFEPVAGRQPRPRMIVTLRPEGGVWLRAVPHEGRQGFSIRATNANAGATRRRGPTWTT